MKKTHLATWVIAASIGLAACAMPSATAPASQARQAIEAPKATAAAQQPADTKSAAPARPGPPTPNADSLLAQLRSGGVVIVIRHAATDRSQPDAEQVDFADCSTQRNLTDAGRADAHSIGEAFRTLQLPVGTVWTSPYCRAWQTAELAFGRYEVIDGLERLYPVPDEVAEHRINRLIREQAPAPGDPNMVIAGHGLYPSVLEPAVSLGEGEAARAPSNVVMY